MIVVNNSKRGLPMLHVLLDFFVAELRTDEMFESKDCVCRVDRPSFCRGSNEALLRFCKGGGGVGKESLCGGERRR